jgi:hypothetical protein
VKEEQAVEEPKAVEAEVVAAVEETVAAVVEPEEKAPEE